MSQRLWRDRQFRIFWSAQAVSEFGDRVTELALPLIAVTMLDASPGEVGLLTAAVWLPNLASLFIGTWVDEHGDKRPLMIAADLSRTVVLLSLPVAYWLGMLTIAHLYVIAILAGTAHVVFNTAYASFYPRLVSQDNFMDANSKLSTTRSISFMAGPAIGGAMIQWLTAPVAVLIDAVSFVFSAAQIRRLRTPVVEPEPTTESLLARARAGMGYLVRHPYLRPILGCVTTVNFFTFMAQALLILYASRNLGLSEVVIGLAFGIGATGGLIGAVAAAPLSRLVGAGRLIAISAMVIPGAIVIAALASGPEWVRAVALAGTEFIAGFAVMCLDIPNNAMQAAVTHERMRSRVSGARSTINYGARPVGAVVGGLLGTWLGVRETLLISSAGGLLAVLWLIGSPIPGIRQVEGLRPPD